MKQVRKHSRNTKINRLSNGNKILITISFVRNYIANVGVRGGRRAAFSHIRFIILYYKIRKSKDLCVILTYRCPRMEKVLSKLRWKNNPFND